MKIVIDTDTGRLMAAGPEGVRDLPLASPGGWDVLSRLRRTAAANANPFTWLGQPVDQLPEELFQLQELIFAVKPTAIVRMGFRGVGSLLFDAGLLRLLGGGKVIGVDSDISAERRQAMAGHSLADEILLVAGDVAQRDTVRQVQELLPADSRVLVIVAVEGTKDLLKPVLDACESLVSVGSCLAFTETDVRSAAAVEFAMEHADFRWEPPCCLRRVK